MGMDKRMVFRIVSCTMLGFITLIVIGIGVSNFTDTPTQIKNTLQKSIVNNKNMLVKVINMSYNDNETVVTLEITNKRIQDGDVKQNLVLYDLKNRVVASQVFYLDAANTDSMMYDIVFNGIYSNVDHVRIESK